MNAGELSREELQRWVANRYYYQRSIPIKDAAILSNCPEVAIRRDWISRILDHDGVEGESSGGIESWLRLGESLGVDRDEIRSERARAPRRALLGRRLRQLLPPGTVGLRRRLLAHRAVRPGGDQGAAGGARGALPVDRPGRARVLPLAADARPARRRVRARRDPGALPHPRRPGARGGGPLLQVRPALGAARRDRPRRHAARGRARRAEG